MNIKITGSGSYIPEIIVSNLDFSDHHFMNEDGTPFAYSNETVIGKFKGITGIEERRYAESSIITSDMAYLASDKAIKNAGIDPESLDYIIVAHNFGDIKSGTIQSDALPCLAARVKNKLQIQNPKCVAFDILFGCPGWIEGMLQAYALIKSGMAQKCLVIGAEALNTAIEKVVDIASPEWNEAARQAKDAAAASVLIFSLCAATVGIVIFLPKVQILLATI